MQVLTQIVSNNQSEQGVFPVDREKIAKKLVSLRGGRSREFVSNSVGISASALTMYEIGDRVPRDEIKIALANFYGVKVGYLFFDEN